MTINLPYAYAAGNTLNPALHNTNLISDALGNGILTEINGGINTTNLALNWKIRAEHVQTEERVVTAVRYRRRHQHFYSDGAPADADSELRNRFFQMSGAGVRHYVPYDCDVLFLQWQLFVHNWRYKLIVGDNPLQKQQIVKTFYDGSALEYTARPLPETVVFVPAAAPALGTIYLMESIGTQWFCLAAMATDVSAGWHDLSVRLYQEATDGTTADIVRNTGANADGADPVVHDDWTHAMHNRVSLGVSDVAMIGFGA